MVLKGPTLDVGFVAVVIATAAGFVGNGVQVPVPDDANAVLLFKQID